MHQIVSRLSQKTTVNEKIIFSLSVVCLDKWLIISVRGVFGTWYSRFSHYIRVIFMGDQIEVYQ